MPRTDRGVAQRYAARKRKRRSGARLPDEGLAPAERLAPAGELDEREADEALPERPTRQPATSGHRGVRVVMTGRQHQQAPARTFASYADEYTYVVGDLRRVAMVSGGLLVGLVALSLVIH
jgi:hypothetical protein